MAWNGPTGTKQSMEAHPLIWTTEHSGRARSPRSRGFPVRLKLWTRKPWIRPRWRRDRRVDAARLARDADVLFVLAFSEDESGVPVRWEAVGVYPPGDAATQQVLSNIVADFCDPVTIGTFDATSATAISGTITTEAVRG